MRECRGRNAEILVLAVLGLLAPLCHARGATVTVTGTGDTVAVDGAVTLREAITSINNGANVNADVVAVGAYGTNDTVAFNITGGCATACTITTAGFPPALAVPMTIDGYTQPGASANTNAFPAAMNTVLRIELNTPAGLTVNAAGTTIRGLAINRNNGAAITISAAGGNVTIAGNFIGSNPAGTIAMPGTGGFAVAIELGSNIVIGGSAPADRNLLSGDRQGGVLIDPFGGVNDGTRIQGNFIGPDVTGTVSLNGPTSGGIRADGNSPGNKTTNTAIIGNLISGNATAITDGSAGGVIQGNLIGTQRDGITPLPNTAGVLLFSNGSNITVGGSGAGQANVIAFNSPNGPGIQVQSSSNGNLISQNSIHDNANLGITLQFPGIPLANDACDVDTAPGNLGQNYPVITAAVIAAGNVTISGTLNSTASTDFRLEFFSNTACDPSGNGQGQTFIGFANATTPVGNCDVSFGPLVFPVPAGQTIFTATATELPSNTSEFSACFPVVGAVTPTNTPTSTPTNTPTLTPTNTPAGVATSTPTSTPTRTPTQGGAPAVVVPTLTPGLLALLGLALAAAAILLIRRSG
jgi:hypothetical protein